MAETVPDKKFSELDKCIAHLETALREDKVLMSTHNTIYILKVIRDILKG